MQRQADMLANSEFLEIEHKYNVGKAYNKEALFQSIQNLGPLNFFETTVTDEYFFANNAKDHYVRFRKDPFLVQLTVKSRQADSQQRLEVNLNLESATKDQISTFLAPLGYTKNRSVAKKVWVFEFADAEIVYYKAKSGSQEFFCVEIESRNPTSPGQGVQTIGRYEAVLDLLSVSREKRALCDLFGW